MQGLFHEKEMVHVENLTTKGEQYTFSLQTRHIAGDLLI